MKFSELVGRVRAWLEQESRVSYRALKRELDLSDEDLEDLKAELIDAKRLAVDEDGKVLVWAGASPVPGSEFKVQSSLHSPPQILDVGLRTLDPVRSDGERRQLTVMFIDLVGSTTLSQQLDPEDYHGRVVAYQTACHQIIARYEGHIAQYLGDGVLVYFGYPTAHEEDAVRAVRSGLEIVTAVRQLAYTPPLQVRIGIHTGPVVVGEIGAGERTERLALGDTPNLAARIQGQANPDEVMISAATYRLVAGFFACEDRGQPELKGVTTPLTLYCVVKESAAQSRFDVAVQAGLTPLVGRDEELALLRRRWEQATDGEGQVVLLSGEPGIGKSRLVQELKDHVAQDNAVRIAFRCSPYHQNSAFYPVIEYLQRILQFNRDDSSEQKLGKLEQRLSHARLDLQATVPLFSSFLSLPAPRSPLPAFSPQQQKQKTLDALVHWLFEEAERATVYAVWEDLHWADPSTLEFLALCLDQVPTTRMLMLLTFRPEFTPAWTARSHLSHLVLSRLGRKQTSTIVEQIAGGKALPSEVLQRIVAKTDGVPLFVEELTKMVVEATREQVTGDGGQEGKIGEAQHAAPLSLGIPATLQDALMARLDRLGTAKEVAQQGAVVGRELTYELLSAISPLTEVALQQELTKLVEAELLYQRGLPPQATYLFKHALVQETAYQSLLKSKRQQYHHQIAKIFETRFPDTTEAQPELVAHHYTEAGLVEQAIPYWQQAGQRASERSAHAEAIAHLTKGLEVLKTLPDTHERAQQELLLQTALGPALMITKGLGTPEVEKAYTRARELCRQVGETPQLLPVLFGLCRFYNIRAEHQTARELGEQLLRLAQLAQEPTHLVGTHYTLGGTLYWLGEFASARSHLEQSIALYDPQQHRSLAFVYGTDPGVTCLSYMAWTLWDLGYPDQARERIQEALILAQELSHPFSLATALGIATEFHLLCREGQAAEERAEALMTLSNERGFPHWLAVGTILRGWALAEQGQGEEGVAQIRQGLAAHQATGAELSRTIWFGLLAEAYGKMGQTEEGLNGLAEALELAEKTGERRYEAELYRLKGQLTLQKLSVVSSQLSVPSTQPLTPSTQEVEQEAEACFLKAIEIARKQQAKSLELRAVMSLVRLRQQQASEEGSRNTQHESRVRLAEAHQMLSEVYNWFTEGFDTKDLQEAKTLLAQLTEDAP